MIQTTIQAREAGSPDLKFIHMGSKQSIVSPVSDCSLSVLEGEWRAPLEICEYVMGFVGFRPRDLLEVQKTGAFICNDEWICEFDDDHGDDVKFTFVNAYTGERHAHHAYHVEFSGCFMGRFIFVNAVHVCSIAYDGTISTLDVSGLSVERLHMPFSEWMLRVGDKCLSLDKNENLAYSDNPTAPGGDFRKSYVARDQFEWSFNLIIYRNTIVSPNGVITSKLIVGSLDDHVRCVDHVLPPSLVPLRENTAVCRDGWILTWDGGPCPPKTPRRYAGEFINTRNGKKNKVIIIHPNSIYSFDGFILSYWPGVFGGRSPPAYSGKIYQSDVTGRQIEIYDNAGGTSINLYKRNIVTSFWSHGDAPVRHWFATRDGAPVVTDADSGHRPPNIPGIDEKIYELYDGLLYVECFCMQKGILRYSRCVMQVA